jgi:hypothetical protein
MPIDRISDLFSYNILNKNLIQPNQLTNIPSSERSKLLFGLKSSDDVRNDSAFLPPINRNQENKNIPPEAFSTDIPLTERLKILLGLKSPDEIEQNEDVNRENIPIRANIQIRIRDPLSKLIWNPSFVTYSGEGTIQVLTPAHGSSAVARHEAHHIAEHRLEAARKGYQITSQYIIYYHKVNPKTGEIYISGGRTVTRMRKVQIPKVLGSKIDTFA